MSLTAERTDALPIDDSGARPGARAGRFVELFNRLDAHFRERTGLTDRGLGFGQVLREAEGFLPGVRPHGRRLRTYAELRNLLVHAEGRPLTGIAEPTPEALADFERIVRAITDPKRADSIGTGNPHTFAAAESLDATLSHMREHGFSQAVVRDDEGRLALLSTEGIARWLGSHSAQGILELSGVALREAICHEPSGTVRVIRRDVTEHEVRRYFRTPPSRDGARLTALLVTGGGSPRDVALRIITPWDVLRLDT